MYGAGVHVPVEHRWLGLDKRTVWPALAVLAVGVLWAFVLPAVDGATRVSRPASAGTVLAAGPDVAFAPAVGWQVLSGVPAGQGGSGIAATQPAVVASGGMELTVQQVSWTGSLTALFARASQVSIPGNGSDGRFDGPRTTVRTGQGVAGISQSFITGSGPGHVSAYLLDGTGVRVVATGTSDESPTMSSEVQQMESSILIASPAPAPASPGPGQPAVPQPAPALPGGPGR